MLFVSGSKCSTFTNMGVEEHLTKSGCSLSNWDNLQPVSFSETEIRRKKSKSILAYKFQIQDLRPDTHGIFANGSVGQSAEIFWLQVVKPTWIKGSDGCKHTSHTFQCVFARLSWEHDCAFQRFL